MNSSRYVKPFRTIYFCAIIVSLCAPIMMGMVTILSNRVESVLDIFDDMILSPLEYGVPFFIIMILLGIAGILIDSARSLRYFLISFGYSALIVAEFVFGAVVTFMDFFNIRAFI